MTAALHSKLTLVAPERAATGEYYAQRHALALTAENLRKRGLRTADAFVGAFAIVGEEISDNNLRQKLQTFFIGRSGVMLVQPSTTKLYSGPSRRSFEGLPTARRLAEQVTRYATHSEPLAVYLVRNQLTYEPCTMSLQEQESHAGALIRSLSQDESGTFSDHEVTAAALPLIPTLESDLQLSLRTVWSEYRQLYAT